MSNEVILVGKLVTSGAMASSLSVPQSLSGRVAASQGEPAIPDGYIGTSKLANGAVTSDKIANGAVGANQLGVAVSYVVSEGNLTIELG